MPSNPAIPVSSIAPADEHHVVHSVQATLRFIFAIVPIIAGLDKYSNLLCDWTVYLNPLALRIVPVTGATFMHVVGVIEIVAGLIVFSKPRIGAYIVMVWLIAIALQLVVWGRYLDIAVRDLVIALGGALSLGRLSPYSVPSK